MTKLVVTIDTEEDDWGTYKSSGYSLENINRLQEFQKIANEFCVKPTYLVNYPVATDPRAVEVLMTIGQCGKAEIGAHLHPWNTPPYEEERSIRNSMLCNLPKSLQRKKIERLHEVIQSNFGIDPVSFRSGRWGFSGEVANHLYDIGYRIDTSITPYTDLRTDFGPDFSNFSPRPFKLLPKDDFSKENAELNWLAEVPATIGFLQRDFALCNCILKMVKKRPIRYLKIAGILYRLNIISKVWLNPEFYSADMMIELAKKIITNGYQVLNLFFHSTTLEPGLTPFVRDEAEYQSFLERIRGFFRYATEAGADSVTMSEILDSGEMFAKRPYPDDEVRLMDSL